MCTVLKEYEHGALAKAACGYLNDILYVAKLAVRLTRLYFKRKFTSEASI